MGMMVLTIEKPQGDQKAETPATAARITARTGVGIAQPDLLIPHEIAAATASTHAR
jgi:hypothetical protein